MMGGTLDWAEHRPGVCDCPDHAPYAPTRHRGCLYAIDVDRDRGRCRWHCACGERGRWQPRQRRVYHAWRHHARTAKPCRRAA